jgi:hypothetical protein
LRGIRSGQDVRAPPWSAKIPNSPLISGPDSAYMVVCMSRLGYPGKLGVESAARQSVFPLRVAVCAWCQPKELGAGLGALSHGICPRHLRDLELELQSSHPGRAGESIGPRARRSRQRRRSIEETGQLRFLFPAPFAVALPFSA